MKCWQQLCFARYCLKLTGKWKADTYVRAYHAAFSFNVVFTLMRSNDRSLDSNLVTTCAWPMRDTANKKEKKRKRKKKSSEVAHHYNTN